MDDYAEVGAANVDRVQKKTKTDKNLYEVEVVDVDKERKRLKIYYVGYNEQFNKWRDYDCEGNYFLFLRVEKLLLPDESSLGHRRNICLNSTSQEAFEYTPILSRSTCLAQNPNMFIIPVYYYFLSEYGYYSANFHDSSNSRFLQNF